MKGIRIFFRSISESMTNVGRNLSLSIASISCISITLVLVAVSIILSQNVNSFTTAIEKDVTIVATGLCVNESLEAAKILEAAGIDAEIINIHTIKPLDEEIILASAKKTGCVVTVEEHSVIGGLGSAVCDVLSEKAPTRTRKIGIMDTFGESGPAAELIKKYGIDSESIAAKTKSFLGK